MTLPDITIVMTTYFPEGDTGIARYKAMSQTVLSWEKHLKYEGIIRLHMADDGSQGYGRPTYYDSRLVTTSNQNRKGVGASLNTGFQIAYKHSPLVAYFVDDWSLTQELDITAWAKVLLEREDIGMVRLGMPHPNLTGRVEHLGELGWGLILDSYSYAYGQRPAIYHKRFTDAYGRFPEDCSAMDCERMYSERVNAMEGPKVMLALPHSWKHLDSVSMSDWTPV